MSIGVHLWLSALHSSGPGFPRLQPTGRRCGGRPAIERIDGDRIDPACARVGHKGRGSGPNVQHVAPTMGDEIHGEALRVFGQRAGKEWVRRRFKLSR